MSSSESSTTRTRRAHVESDENRFEIEIEIESDDSTNQLRVPSSRPPLNSIPDPSQLKPDAPNFAKADGNSIYATPKASKLASATTPARSVSKSANSRASFYNGGGRVGGGGDCSRVSRGYSGSTHEMDTTIPYFQMEEDPSFWTDHNVQVLIRIRPISSLESGSLGRGRCLKQESAQSLLWLGQPETRFTFDHVACETISQEKLFKVAGLPMVENCMSGYNSCMFAYGQTGSGKTYTMMGDIQEMDGKLNEDRGITPRIFEYLFSRICMEEAKRKDEKLKYCCKCSFLEIYNEQITDLLEPSSINLQLREDLKKGVYVENLTEHSVSTVNDVIELLVQGSTNRRVASTNMNSESSRSHSVFTCTIESSWEKDSTTHLRFGRLNLVDLAGSERQKTSGAEGDRLKEAANINKSLSTLGMVIMSLLDMAQGKQRHVPYRDSRLTFLLQDSLGGNSKTMIIANVSPSICSANETFSTLKFAQRAKLIQNNAKVNEDASGDVPALQRQVNMLKDQLSLLINNHKLPKSLPCPVTLLEEPQPEPESSDDRLAIDCHTNAANTQHKKIARLEALLIGALRREKQAEAAVHKLEAEIEHLNRLAQERDEDAQRGKMMMRFREEKIKRLEMLSDGSYSDGKYLMEENDALLKEIQALQAKMERNPEVTRFALENIRLLDQLQQYQNFYENGERENLLAEISDLSDQLFDTLDLIKSSESKIRGDAADKQYIKLNQDLQDAKLVINVMESQQLHQMEELEVFPDNNQKNIYTFHRDRAPITSEIHAEDYSGSNVERKCNIESVHSSNHGTVITALQNKFNVISKELATIQQMNSQYHENHESELFQRNQVDRDMVLEQVEIETAKTILHLQEEVASLRSELQARSSCMAHENMDLRNKLAAMEVEMKESTMKWERATLELTSFLIDGCQSLTDVSTQIEEIAYSFPRIDGWINAQVMKAGKVCIEKEEIILSLQRSLEDAQNLVQEIELKIRSLREAGLALTAGDKHEAHESDNELMLQVKNELLETSGKLSIIGNSLKSLSNMYNNQVNSEASEPAECSTDYSSSSSESSTAYTASNNEETCTPEFINADSDLHLTGASGFPLPMHEYDSLKTRLQKSAPYEMITIELEKELRQTKDAFRKLYSMLAERFTEKFEASTEVEGDIKVFPCTGPRRKRARTCPDIDECSSPSSMLLRAERERDSTIIFLTKFEEAQSTIKEADMMLNALVDANEKSKHLTSLWRQAGKDLMLEKTHLLDEVSQLKHSAAVQEKENVQLQEDFQHCYMELRSLMTLLETSFKEMHLDMEEQLKIMYSEVSSIVQDLLICIQGLRLVYGKLMEKKLALSLSVPQSNHNDDSEKRYPNSIERAVGDYHTCPASEYDPMNKSSSQYFSAVHKSTFDKYLAKGDHDDLVQENDFLKEEIDRKDSFLNGLLFDFSLLQESASNAKDVKDKSQMLESSLSSIQKELELKTKQLADIQVEHERSMMQLPENEKALSLMSSDLEQATEMIEILSAQNQELGTLVEDLYTKKSETDKQLKEQKEIVRNLENEVLRLSDSTDRYLLSPIGSVDEALCEAADEKSRLIKEIEHLKEKVDMAYALADENEALVIEARQESETSRIYAEEKEEEARILERSVEELENTINVLEKKVFEMDDEVKRHKLIRDSLEQEVQALRQRMLNVEELTGSMDMDDKSMEFQEARNRIMFLERERSRQEAEIKQLKEYISEIVLHAEAQTSQYQHKYKSLEATLCEIKKDPLNDVSTMSTVYRTEKLPTRPRGSSSPFRCISSLVQQMNTEKDQELSVARLRIGELEALNSKQKKEVCMLNSRLAAAESMTHDVIRDLLGVKLDITNYASIIDQHQVQQLLEVAHQQTEEAVGKEQEILILRKQIEDLTEERESFISESKQRRAQMLTAQMTLEQLQEHEQWLSAQNRMLKMDKINLKRKVAELDDMIKRLLSEKSSHQRVQQPTRIELQGSTSSKFQDTNFTKSLTQSEKTLSRVNDELAQYRRMAANHLRNHNQIDRHSTETKYRS